MRVHGPTVTVRIRDSPSRPQVSWASSSVAPQAASGLGLAGGFACCPRYRGPASTWPRTRRLRLPQPSLNPPQTCSLYFATCSDTKPTLTCQWRLRFWARGLRLSVTAVTVSPGGRRITVPRGEGGSCPRPFFLIYFIFPPSPWIYSCTRMPVPLS